MSSTWWCRLLPPYIHLMSFTWKVFLGFPRFFFYFLLLFCSCLFSFLRFLVLYKLTLVSVFIYTLIMLISLCGRVHRKIHKSKKRVQKKNLLIRKSSHGVASYTLYACILVISYTVWPKIVSALLQCVEGVYHDGCWCHNSVVMVTWCGMSTKWLPVQTCC